MISFIISAIIIIYFCLIQSGLCQPRTPDIRPLRSNIYFKGEGTLSSLVANGAIRFDVNVGGLFKAIHEQCRLLQNLPQGKGHLLKDDKTSRLAMAQHYFSKAQRLTAILTTWIDEDDIHLHPILQTRHAVFKAGHHAASAPLHPLNSKETAKEGRSRYNRFKVTEDNMPPVHDNNDNIVLDQPASDQPISEPTPTNPVITLSRNIPRFPPYHLFLIPPKQLILSIVYMDG